MSDRVEQSRSQMKSRSIVKVVKASYLFIQLREGFDIISTPLVVNAPALKRHDKVEVTLDFSVRGSICGTLAACELIPLSTDDYSPNHSLNRFPYQLRDWQWQAGSSQSLSLLYAFLPCATHPAGLICLHRASRFPFEPLQDPVLRSGSASAFETLRF